VIDEDLPHPEGIRPREAKVAARDELIPAVVVRFLDDGFESARMAVNVGDAEEAHDLSRSFGVQLLRQDC
jgi:hypothetical protein